MNRKLNTGLFALFTVLFIACCVLLPILLMRQNQQSKLDVVHTIAMDNMPQESLNEVNPLTNELLFRRVNRDEAYFVRVEDKEPGPYEYGEQEAAKIMLACYETLRAWGLKLPKMESAQPLYYRMEHPVTKEFCGYYEWAVLLPGYEEQKITLVIGAGSGQLISLHLNRLSDLLATELLAAFVAAADLVGYDQEQIDMVGDLGSQWGYWEALYTNETSEYGFRQYRSLIQGERFDLYMGDHYG